MTVAVSTMAVTWSDGALHTAVKMNVTDTSSNASSLLLDLQVGGTSRFNIVKSGKAVILLDNSVSGSAVALSVGGAGGATVTFCPSNNSGSQLNVFGILKGCGGFLVRASDVYKWSPDNTADTTSADIGTGRNAAGLMEVNTGVSIADGGSLRDITLRDIFTNDASFLLRTKTTITGGSTGNAPTLTAGPVTGNPTKWLGIDDNGTTRYVPAW